MEEILNRYQQLLETVDRWFARFQERAADQVRCVRGCSACCRGLFDITLLDARLLQAGFARLPVAQQETALVKARERLAQLQDKWPGFDHPFTLNHLPDEEWVEMPEDDETPCPLLVDDQCLVYEYRPLICRSHGIPHIDHSGEVFDDSWCTRNFPATDPLLMTELRWHFRTTYANEIQLFRRFTTKLLGHPVGELDTFIPVALLINFDDFA